jgi:hypothetical protein
MSRSRLQSRIALAFAVLTAAVLPAQTVKPVAVIQPAPASQWQSYTYPADGFKASFPIQPGTDKKTIPTPAGSFEMRSYLAMDGASALIISICDYGAAASGKDPATLLQGAKNGALQNSQSHLISEHNLTLDSNPGLEFEAESEAIHTTDRLYIVGTTLYQVQVSAPITQPYAQAARFLDSFQLIPRTPAATTP